MKNMKLKTVLIMWTLIGLLLVSITGCGSESNTQTTPKKTIIIIHNNPKAVAYVIDNYSTNYSRINFKNNQGVDITSVNWTMFSVNSDNDIQNALQLYDAELAK